jgi:hypothetical protein
MKKDNLIKVNVVNNDDNEIKVEVSQPSIKEVIKNISNKYLHEPMTNEILNNFKSELEV